MKKYLLAENYFLEGYACAQSVIMAYVDELDIDMKTAQKISSTFGGGMGRLRKTCGALTGAFMVIGLKYGNLDPKNLDVKLHSYSIVRKQADKFKEKYGTIECAELLEKYTDADDVKEREHHNIICHKLIKSSVKILETLIDIENGKSVTSKKEDI